MKRKHGLPRTGVRTFIVSPRAKRVAAALLLLIAIGVAAALAHGPVVRALARTGNPLYDLDKAAWVWDATLIAPPSPKEAGSGQASFLDRLRELNITRVFLNAGWEKTVSGPYLAAKPEQYDQFIKAAGARRVAVEALFGEPSFAKADHWADLARHVNLVLEYNRLHANRFSALHLDIEPYGCADYKGNEARILSEYLAALQKVKDMVVQHNQANRDHLRLVLDLPVWWDAQNPKVNGQPLVPQLLQLADEVVVMNYTTDAREFIERGKRWLNAAAASKATVTMGLEFQPEVRGATLSALAKEDVGTFMRTTWQEFRINKQFGGFAVHHFGPFNDYCRAQARRAGTTGPR